MIIIIIMMLLINCYSYVSGNIVVNDLDSNFIYYYSEDGDGVVLGGYKGTDAIVVIPEIVNEKRVIMIGNGAFAGIKTIQYIILPDSIIEIGENAFMDCSVESISIPNGLKKIGDGAFANSNISSVVIPASVQYLGCACFWECAHLTKVYIDALIGEIPDYCFFECVSLREIQLSNSINTIGEYAFYYCPQIDIINIPQCLKLVKRGNFTENTFLWPAFEPFGLDGDEE